MKVIKSIIIAAIATISLLYAGTSEILNPKTNVYDFTYNNVQQNSNTYNNGTIIAKVAYEIESTLALLPRTFKVESCPADSYGNRYCPEALSTASNIWTYDQSQVVEQKQYVTDYEQGNYKEFTSSVRDFMDGFASTHNSTVTDYQSGSGTANVGTVIDYQNGSSSIGTGSVMDFTSKVNSTTNNKSCETLPNQYFCVQGIGCLYYSQCKIQPQDNPGQDTGQGWIDLRDKSATAPRSQTMLNYYASTYTGAMTNSTHIGVVWQNGLFRTTNTRQTEDKWIDFYNTSLNQSQLSKHIRVDFINGKIYPWHTTQSYISSSKPTYTRTQSEHYIDLGLSTTTTLACPSGYTDNGTNCQKLVSYNFYQYTCPATYSPINSGFTSYTKTDPNTSAENWNTLDDTINSATPPTGNCKKTITYSYYKYNCPTGYTVNDGGLTSACPRTDPNNTINNESTLSQACNNSTPPTGNCTKVIPYTFYSYECNAGYTAIDKGLATCTKTDSSASTDTSSTLDDPCNSIIPPKENCYKDISYKHYTYGCSPGYITDNYGLSNCPKTDPNKSINNSDSLDDACNSATPPIGNCRKEVQYSFYKYVCNGVNEFGEPYYPINSGLSSCAKTDANKNTVDGSTLDDPCNNDTVASNNCRAQAYTCNSSIITPALVNGTWQCSPYPCNSENKCGTAVCNDYAPSDTYYMPSNLSPIKAEYTGTCKGALCDAVINNKISYCQKFACPSQPGVYEKDGKCWYDECPVGTYVDANGNCVQK